MTKFIFSRLTAGEKEAFAAAFDAARGLDESGSPYPWAAPWLWAPEWVWIAASSIEEAAEIWLDLCRDEIAAAKAAEKVEG